MRRNIGSRGRCRARRWMATLSGMRRVGSNRRTAEGLSGSVDAGSRPRPRLAIGHLARAELNIKIASRGPGGMVCPSLLGHGGIKGKMAYHSPPALPSPLRLGSCVLPAAAEAKLEGSGVGIVKGCFGRTMIPHLTTDSRAVRRETLCGGRCANV